MLKKYGSGHFSDDSGEISWPSSDNETFNDQTFGNTSLKSLKNRRPRKKRGPNLSNLNITITADTSPNGEHQTSPVLFCTKPKTSLPSLILKPSSPALYSAKPKTSLPSPILKPSSPALYSAKPKPSQPSPILKSSSPTLCSAKPKPIPKSSSPALRSSKPKTILPSHILKPVNSPVVQTSNRNYIFSKEWAEAESADYKNGFTGPRSPILKSSSSIKPLHSPPSPILTPCHSPLPRKLNLTENEHLFNTKYAIFLENDDKKSQNLRSQITGSAERECYIKSPILSPKNTNFTQRSLRRKLNLTDGKICTHDTSATKLDNVKQFKISQNISNIALEQRKHISETATLDVPISIDRNQLTIAEPQISTNTPKTTTERRKRINDTSLPSPKNVSVQRINLTGAESPKSIDTNTSVDRQKLATTESMAKDAINTISNERGKHSIIKHTPKTHNSYVEKRKLNADVRIPKGNAVSKQSNDINSKEPQETRMPPVQQDKAHLSPVLTAKRTASDLLSPPDERMVKKIKSYFDSYFSTQSSSQVTISDSTPQSQKTIKEQGIATQIDITESPSPAVSQDADIKISVSSENSTSSKNTIEATSSKTLVKNEVDEMEPKRKRRYKKDGLAQRLQVLLKKQRNQQFLWRHEMYLAANSNFVVPNSSPFRLFGIKKVHADYGNYLIEAVDTTDRKEYLILLNTNVEYSFTVSEKSFLKLYEPFEVMETECGTVIVNACKFECISVKKEE